MEFTRRRLLGAGVTGAAASLSGCFGIGGSDGEAGGSDGGSGSGGSDGGSGSNQEQTETPTATPEPEEQVPVLVERTAAILDEVDWYANRYDATLRQFTVRVNPVIGQIKDMQEASSVSEDDIAKLTELTTNVATFVRQNMVAHFDVPTPLTKGENVYVQQIGLARRRGDGQELRTTMNRMKLFYQQVISKPFVQNEFPKTPVYDELYSLLVRNDNTTAIFGITYPSEGFSTYAYPDKTDETGTDGVDQHVHEFPSGQRYYTHAHEHGPDHALDEHKNEPESDRLYAHSDDGIDLLEDAVLWRDLLTEFETAQAGLFDPLASENRIADLFVTADQITKEFTAEAIYVQRFPSSDVASTTLETFAEGNGTTEGTTPFAKREWTRVYYQIESSTIYAFVIQAGPFLVAAGASPRPWGKRPEWSKPFERTWLAIPPNSEE